TLRHFPQSFEFSTLGGWIATRSGGHYATLHTHIDDFVESIRAVTPRGAWESRRLPGSGAGPSPDRMLLGSEGTLGVITEAWMRRAVECALDYGARIDEDAIVIRNDDSTGAREGAAGSWRNAFIRAPYTRDAVVGLGMISETFETACTWDRFETLHEAVTT